MWKDIKGFEGLYQVSDEGQIRRFYKNGKTKLVKGKDGSKYYSVDLCKNGIKKSCNIHKLVAEAFLEKPKGYAEVNHKDGNKKNNRLKNLEWVSQRGNLEHAMNQLHHYPFGKAPRRVRCIDIETGEVVEEFQSVAEASRRVGRASARTTITIACQGLKDKAYGYRWEYID